MFILLRLFSNCKDTRIWAYDYILSNKVDTEHSIGHLSIEFGSIYLLKRCVSLVSPLQKRSILFLSNDLYNYELWLLFIEVALSKVMATISP